MLQQALSAAAAILLPQGCCVAEDDRACEGGDATIFADHDERGRLELDEDCGQYPRLCKGGKLEDGTARAQVRGRRPPVLRTALASGNPQSTLRSCDHVASDCARQPHSGALRLGSSDTPLAADKQPRPAPMAPAPSHRAEGTAAAQPARLSALAGGALSGHCCAAQASPEDFDEAEVLAIRARTRDFVLALIRGMALSVVVEAGRTEGCRFSLATNFTQFHLEAGGKKYDIPLRDVRRACPGPLPQGAGAPAALDEMCNTLVLVNGECVSFRFDNKRERDDFAVCINLLVTCTDV